MLFISIVYTFLLGMGLTISFFLKGYYFLKNLDEKGKEQETKPNTEQKEIKRVYSEEEILELMTIYEDDPPDVVQSKLDLIEACRRKEEADRRAEESERRLREFEEITGLTH